MKFKNLILLLQTSLLIGSCKENTSHIEFSEVTYEVNSNIDLKAYIENDKISLIAQNTKNTNDSFNIGFNSRNNLPLMFTSYKDGLLNGDYYLYYDNGTVENYTQYSKGKWNGVVIDFYKNQQVKSLCYSSMGIPKGEKFDFDEHGNILHYSLFDTKGTQVEHQDFSNLNILDSNRRKIVSLFLNQMKVNTKFEVNPESYK